MAKKVLITGAAGFVGTNFSNFLLKRGYEVIGIDIGDRHNRLSETGLLKNSAFRFEVLDLAQEIPLASKLFDVDIIYHFAALPHVDYSSFFPRKVINNNIESLLTIIDAATSLDIPMVFSSSVEVYGGKEDKLYSENDQLTPLSPYAASKVACEAIVGSYCETQNLRATIFRFTNLFGPLQAPDRLIPRIVSQLLIDEPATVEKGTNRDFVYIDDACRVLESAIEFTHQGEIFNLSTGVKTDNFKAVEIIKRDFINSDITIKEPRDRDGRGKFLVSNPQKLLSKIGWIPKTDLSGDIKKTISWYKEHTQWLEQFHHNLKSDRLSHNFLTDSTWGGSNESIITS